MKCTYCEKRAVAGYSDKFLCKKHYNLYLKQAHEWQEKRWRTKTRSLFERITISYYHVLKDKIKKVAHLFSRKDKLSTAKKSSK